MPTTVKITGKHGMSDLSIPLALSRWENEVAPAVLAEISRLAPVSKGPGSGTLRDSFSVQRSKTGSGITARFVSSAPYAQYVEYGTVGHGIEPRNANALHWTTGGEDVFAKYVNHPGTKPNDFVARAIKNMTPMMLQALKKNAQEELEA